MGSCASCLKGDCQIYSRPEMVIEPLFVQAHPLVVPYNFSVIFFRLNNGVLGVIYYAVTLSSLSDIEMLFAFPTSSHIGTHQRDSKSGDIGPNKMPCFKQGTPVLVCKLYIALA